MHDAKERGAGLICSRRDDSEVLVRRLGGVALSTTLGTVHSQSSNAMHSRSTGG